MTLPSQESPTTGVFVARRLEALSTHVRVRALRPQPWFPVLRSDPVAEMHSWNGLNIHSCRMHYIVGIAKSLDGYWMQRSIRTWLAGQDWEPASTALDGHFAYPEGVACSHVASEFGLPFFITLRGVEEFWFRNAIVRRQMLKAMDKATGVFSVSQSLKDLAIEHGVSGDRIQVIPNGCDPEAFSPGSQREAREKLGIPLDQKVIVCVGALKKVKGHSVLIEAMSRLRFDHDAHLYCIGGELQSRLARQLDWMCHSLGLNDRVHFLGPCDSTTVASYLRAADVFALASHREGCCNAVLEAIATNTPVVVTDVGDNQRLLRNHQPSQVVPPNDAHAFATAMSNQLNRGRTSDGNGDGTSQKVPSWEEVGAQTWQAMQDAFADSRICSSETKAR